MSVYLWSMTAKEGEAANGEPGGGTEVEGVLPGSLTYSQILPTPPPPALQSHSCCHHLSQLSQHKLLYPRRHISYTVSGDAPVCPAELAGVGTVGRWVLVEVAPRRGCALWLWFSRAGSHVQLLLL